MPQPGFRPGLLGSIALWRSLIVLNSQTTADTQKGKSGDDDDDDGDNYI